MIQRLHRIGQSIFVRRAIPARCWEDLDTRLETNLPVPLSLAFCFYAFFKPPYWGGTCKGNTHTRSRSTFILFFLFLLKHPHSWMIAEWQLKSSTAGTIKPPK
jgi:hypothetical protein